MSIRRQIRSLRQGPARPAPWVRGAQARLPGCIRDSSNGATCCGQILIRASGGAENMRCGKTRSRAAGGPLHCAGFAYVTAQQAVRRLQTRSTRADQHRRWAERTAGQNSGWSLPVGASNYWAAVSSGHPSRRTTRYREQYPVFSVKVHCRVCGSATESLRHLLDSLRPVSRMDLN